jgi:hypothetical protein
VDRGLQVHTHQPQVAGSVDGQDVTATVRMISLTLVVVVGC